MQPRREIQQPVAAPSPGRSLSPGGWTCPDSIPLAVGPIETTFQGTTYRTERTTLVARRVRAAQTSLAAEPSLPPWSCPPPRVTSLCREPACWVLVYEGNRVYLKHEIGLHYVHYLLQHPDEPVSGGLSLASSIRSRRRLPALPARARACRRPRRSGRRRDPSEANLDTDTQRILAAHKAKGAGIQRNIGGSSRIGV